MPRRRKEDPPVTPRIAGPVDFGTRIPLSQSTALEFVQATHRLVFGPESFLVVIYGAVNACGLIGTEHNGIAILRERRGQVVLTDHARDSSYMKASDGQRAEFARICGMDKAAFREFVNGHPEARSKVLAARAGPIVVPRTVFQPADFSETPFTTARQKADFLKELVKFLCHDCDPDRFSKRLYGGLHLHLGHIAHYNAHGFYDVWFADPASRARFLDHHAEFPVYGDWADVSRVFRLWIAGPEGKAVLAHYRKEG